MLILKGVLMIINKSYFVQEPHKQNSHTVLNYMLFFLSIKDDIVILECYYDIKKAMFLVECYRNIEINRNIKIAQFYIQLVYKPHFGT